MSENCPRCGDLTTRKSLSSYNCCAKCHKSDRQLEKQRKKEQKQNEKLAKQSIKMVRRSGNLNF